jgi:hypothetical protein
MKWIAFEFNPSVLTDLMVQAFKLRRIGIGVKIFTDNHSELEELKRFTRDTGIDGLEVGLLNAQGNPTSTHNSGNPPSVFTRALGLSRF